MIFSVENVFEIVVFLTEEGKYDIIISYFDCEVTCLSKRKLCLSLITMMMVFMMSATAFASGFLVKEGTRGADVKRVQVLLIEQGYLRGTADGVCGKMTAAAIRRFQKANGLTADGICGSQTYARLSHGQGVKTQPAAQPQGRIVTVNATAYSAQDPGNSNRTASGTLVRHGVIAVDPSFIPLGTRVYIPDYGEAVAEDVGWGIQGNTIDVAFDTHDEALAFGRQTLDIYILDGA